MSNSKYTLSGNISRLWRILINKSTHQVDAMTEEQAADEMKRLAAEAKEDVLRQAESAERLIAGRKVMEAAVTEGQARLSRLQSAIQRRVDALGNEEACRQDPELCIWMTQYQSQIRLHQEQELTLSRMKSACKKMNEQLTHARATEVQIQGELTLLSHRLEMATLVASSGYAFDPAGMRGRLEDLRNQVAKKEFTNEAKEEVELMMGTKAPEPFNPMDFSEFLGKKEPATLNG